MVKPLVSIATGSGTVLFVTELGVEDFSVSVFSGVSEDPDAECGGESDVRRVLGKTG